jgi:hypothetical protein
MATKMNWLNVVGNNQDSYDKPSNPWDYYTWAGSSDVYARRLRQARAPVYMTEEEYVPPPADPTQSFQAAAPSTQITFGGEEREPTVGEKFAQYIGSAFDNVMKAEGARYGVRAEEYAKKPSEFGATGDFLRAAGYSIPQTIADVGGAVADYVTGNTDKGQNYLIKGNRPEDYAEYGGVAQTLGSIAPDIGLAIATYGGSMATQSAMAGSKINALSRLGRLAMGAEGAAPTAIKAFGRAVTPAALRGERVAATLAGAVPTALNVAPEVVSGRMSGVEAGLQTALGGLGGTLAAGQWGGGRLVNVLSDMAVNVGTQGAAEAVTLLPGGAEFDPTQAWKNMLYGAGLGTAFGIMNSGKIQGPGERVVFGRKVEPAPTPVEAAGFTSKPVDIARQTESMLFGGEPTLKTDATPEEAAQAMQQMRARSGAELQTLQMDEQGNVRSLSDAYLRGEAQQLYPNVPESVLDNAATTERQVYAQTLAAKYASNPEVLIRALDLDVKPGELTPENATQVLASRIENEWLVQASNGKGLGNVEQRLTAVGLEGVKSTADVNAPVTGAVRMPDGTIQAPRSSAPTPAEQYEIANAGAIIPRPASGTTVYQPTPRGVEPYNPQGYQPTPVENIPGERVSAYRTPEGTWAAGPAGPRYLPAEYNEPVTGVASQRISRLPATATFFPDPTLYRFESTQMGQIPVRTEYTPGQPMEMPAQAKLAQMLEQDPQARGQLDQAETLSELTGIPVEEILPEGSPVKDAYVATKQEETTAPQTPETVAPSEGAIAGEDVLVSPDASGEVKKQKRKRIVREAAKTETEATAAESIVEQVPDTTVATITASPSTDPAQSIAVKFGTKIAEVVDNFNLLSQSTRGKKRYVEAAAERLNEFLRGDGAVTTIRKPSGGGKHSMFEQMLADLSDMTVKEFRKAVANGVTSFADGKISITKLQLPLTYDAMVSVPEKSVGFSQGIDKVKQVSDAYKKQAGIVKSDHPPVYKLQTRVSQAIADAYVKMKHDPTNPVVREAYEAMVKETKKQYKSIIDAGVKVVRHDGAGEPYSSSKAMLDDLRNNNQLKFLPNDEAFGAEGAAAYKDNIGIQKSGFKLDDGYELTNSEMFRVVHDYFGHGILGNEFGAIGEENATLQHLSLFTDKAAPAVIAQTRGQNSWVNFSGANEEANALYKQARAAEKAGNKKEAEQLREQAGRLFKFAEPKIGLLPSIFNFQKYGTTEDIAYNLITTGEPIKRRVGTPISPNSSRVDAGSAREGSYQRTSSSYNARIGSNDVSVVAEYAPTESTVKAIQKALPGATVDNKILEITGSPEAFHRYISEAKVANPKGAAVYVYPVEEYADMRLFITEDGKCGAALKPDGDLVSGFSAPVEGKRNRLANMMLIGIKEGATKADCFDTVLPDYYAAFGFRAVAKTPFDPTQAPTAYTDQYGFNHAGWEKETFADWSDGTPDVVFLVYDGGNRATIQDRIGQFDRYKSFVRDQLPTSSYDDALAAVKKALKPRASLDNEHVVRFEDKSIIQDMSDAYHATRNNLDPVVREEIAERREAKTKLDRLYGSADEFRALFDEETSMSRIDPDQPDIPMEAASEVRAEYEALGEDPILVDDSRTIEDHISTWRASWIPALRSAVDFTEKILKKSGDFDNLKLTKSDIRNYLISRAGSGPWQTLGDLYLARTMTPEKRAMMEEAVDNALLSSKANPSSGKSSAARGAKRTEELAYSTPIEKLYEISANVPDSYFDKMYDTYVPKFVEAQEHAAIIAKATGISDVRDVWRYVEWQKSGKKPEQKSKLLDRWNSSSGQNVKFDDDYATSIAQRIESTMAKNGDVFFAYDQLSNYVNADNGAKAFRDIMDYNMLGNPKNPLMGLRNLPIVRSAILTSGLYALDNYVEKMEDDETYFGIPGSVAKTFLGDGETTKYAMAGLFGVATKTGAKHGQRVGFRARVGDSMRRTIDAGKRLAESRYTSFARLTPEMQSQRADMFMAERFPTIKPGTDEYNQTKAQFIDAQFEADVSGGKISDIFNGISRTSSAGTVGIMSKYFADINNLGMRSPFVKDYIIEPYNAMQSQIRQLVKVVEDPINAVLPNIIRQYQKDDNFWDAIWRADYEMSAIEFTADQMSASALALARQEVMDDIKKNYFTAITKDNPDGVVNQGMWDDFNSFQRAVNSLRKEDLRSLTAKSMGINSWKIEEHYGELKIRKDALTETYGAAKEARDIVDEQIKALVQERKSFVKTNGRDAFNEVMPGYKEQLGLLRKEKMQAEANMRQMTRELSNVDKRMGRIEQLDAMIDKSMSNMYMNRHRDGKTPFVLRLEFDKDTKIPSVRREYSNMTDAELGRMEYLREAVMKATKNMDSYQKMVAKRTALQDELDNILQSEDVTPDMDSRIASINDELSKMDGFKPVSEMTDAEIMRFAQTNDILGSQKTIQDMRNKKSIRRGTAAAQMVIDQVLASSDVARAQIVSRTIGEGAINPNYIKGKGNASLADVNNGEVMMYTGKDAPQVDDLVDAISSRVDEPIDRAQLRDMIEKFYTYRDKTIAANGTQIDTVWIDMGAIRKAAEAYLDPYVPNLVKRNNWIGYYNPDNNWTAIQKAAYTVQSLESMQARIKNYNQQTSLREAISNANDWLDKWNINNGLREYVNGMLEYNSPTFNDSVIGTLSDYESQISRVISQGTLFANLGSAIGNRVQGATMAFSHGMQDASTKYGVRRTNPDGTKGEIQWMPSETAARAHVFAKQEQGETGWRTVEGFKAGGLFSPKQYGFAIAAMAAPETTLKYLAKKDGYGTLPKTEQGYWATVYDAVRRTNLDQGGVVGSYAIREGLKTGTKAQVAAERITAITNFVEKQNNFSSILMAAVNAENKFGLTANDWAVLNARQKGDVVTQAMAPYKQNTAQSEASRKLILSEIEKLRETKATMTGREADNIQRQIDLKVDKLNRIETETDILIGKLTDYLVFNRGFEQGNWDKINKSRFENWLLSKTGGRLAMTMTAPMLRAMNSWQGMFRRAGATEGGTGAKLGRAAAPLMGASILTVLLGGAASTASLPGGVLLADIAYLAEYLYHYMNNDENEKLDKIAPRQTWEKLAADMAAKYGIPEKQAVNFVRAAWSEGLIRYYADINVNASAGVLDILAGGAPSGTILNTGKGIFNAAGEITSMMGGTATPYDFMWSISGALPTSAKRISQTALNLAPTSWGGQGAVKLDRDGNAIIDPFTGKPRYLSGWDLTKQTFLGKPWTDTRSMLVAREGGTPLYTPNDKLAWANDLVATPYVSFGAGLRGKGVKEQSNAALFERDAEALQSLITRSYRSYKPAIEEGRNFINTMYRNNELIDLGNGEVIPFRQILSEAAMSGVLPETELKGKGAESMRNKLLTYADQWGRSRAAGDAVIEYYGGEVEVKPTGGLEAPTASDFALSKLGEIYARAYQTGLIRRTARQR